MTELATRAQAFGLIAQGVAAGLSAPWRLYLARGSRYLSLNVGDHAEWDAWRTHLGCPDLSVRVYDAGGEIHRLSVAEVVQHGCRISVELVEEVGPAQVAPADPAGPGDPTAVAEPPARPAQVSGEPAARPPSVGEPSRPPEPAEPTRALAIGTGAAG